MIKIPISNQVYTKDWNKNLSQSKNSILSFNKTQQIFFSETQVKE